MAQRGGAVKHVECSVKGGQGVHEVFEAVARAALVRKNLRSSRINRPGNRFPCKILRTRWRPLLSFAVCCVWFYDGPAWCMMHGRISIACSIVCTT